MSDGQQQKSGEPGTVFLVGAGPGDPGLMTVRALELIERADVILYDRLIPDGALAGSRTDAERIYVGKAPGRVAMAQEEINATLLERAQRGETVVRLKGGDPFVFGRGGEEALALREAGIGFEVVPGVTAGIAASAYAGIPVTHRSHASAVAFITGHEDPDKPETTLDWQALAPFPGTLVFYMSIKQLQSITERLRAAGRAPTEPAAVIERGTWSDQRTVLATLETIAARVTEAGIEPPALTVIGPVAELHEQLTWLEHRPLYGTTVTVTRARAQSSGLVKQLQQLGAEVIEAPLIRTDQLPVTLPELGRFDTICLTSVNGVKILFVLLAESGLDARTLAGIRIATIGPGTAAALREHGITADVVPERSVGEGLVAALDGLPLERVLIVRARGARDLLPDALRARNVEVELLEPYETVPEPLAAERLTQACAARYITFTSASTARNLWQAAGGSPQFGPDTKLISIGPITSTALRELGREPDIEAAQHDTDGLLSALLDDVKGS